MTMSYTRRSLSAIAKLMGDPAVSALSHAQRLDRIAVALGYGTHGALMGGLKASETPDTATDTPPVRVLTAFDFGFDEVLTSAIDQDEEIGDHNGRMVERAFSTGAEADAYQQGVDDTFGAIGRVCAARSGAVNAGFFEARDADPEMDFERWHNEKVRDAEPGIS